MPFFFVDERILGDSVEIEPEECSSRKTKSSAI
jgi:hypothetical protein